MGLRTAVAKLLSPGLMDADQVRELVTEEVDRAKASLPISASYDPNNEGYRPLTGGQQLRELQAVDQTRMQEIAYFMFDSSPMTRRLARMDKTFMFGEPVSFNHNDDEAQKILDRFWKDPDNKLHLDFADMIMWLGLLGEQCWPVDVNPHNGHVTLKYVDPVSIAAVLVNPNNIKQAVRVDLQGNGGRPGAKMAIIRQDKNAMSRDYGRLVGECFYYAINKPFNAPRGRSDYLALFDWIDGLERHGFNYLERAELMLNFIWDITLEGMNEEQIKTWLRINPVPEPGSQRAHNEKVKWAAVAPDLKANDLTAGFDMVKSFIMGSAGRPDSWFGAGGKAYQTEADQFGQVPIKDLDERQGFAGHIAEQLLQFQLDQAVRCGRLTPAQADAGLTVNMPEISKKDLAKLINGVPQLATALAVAMQNRWVSEETATRVFAQVVSQFGVDIDVENELAAAKKKLPPGAEDYEN